MQSLPGEQLSASQLEQRARQFLASGKFRKAREDLKLLCKQDRARYLPLLVQANIGLAREMLAKGMTSEAQQVLAYLKTIASAADLTLLELEQAARSNDWSTLVPRGLATLADRQTTLTALDRRRLADQIVVAFEPLLTDGPTAALAAEAGAVQAAVQAVCEQQWARAAELLRPLPHGSVFSHWKLFLKGVAAFHGGERERSCQCFAAVPPDSVPGKASEAYRLLASPRNSTHGTPPPDAVIEAACRLVGQPALGRPLARAEQFWRNRQPVRSYQMLRTDVPSFPSEDLNVIGALSEFYFHTLFSGTAVVVGELTKYFDELAFNRRNKSTMEAKLMWRALALYYAPHGEAHQLRADWNSFLIQHEKLHGDNPRLMSLALGWLGEQLMATRPVLFGYRRPPMRDQAGALESLCRSVQLDPQNLPSHLHLCDLYGHLKMRSDRNRLLDQMTERFPDNKEVLIQAARGCLERSACKKGLQYLERVRERDLLDPVIPGLMVEGLLQQARQQFQQKRPEPARASLERARGLMVDKPDNLERSRWCVLARHGLLEQAFGDPPRADALLAEARAISPCPEAFLLYAHLSLRAESRSQRGQPTPFSLEFGRDGGRNQIAVHAPILMRIFQHWVRDDTSWHHRAEVKLICKYLAAAARQPFTREQARQLVEQAEQTEHFAEEAQKFVRAILKQDPKDPLFRVFDFIFKGMHEFGNPQESRRRLQSIIEEAARRGDHATVQRAERMIEGLKHGPFPPLPPIDDVFEDEPLDDDEVPDDAGPLPPDDPVFQELVQRITAMSESELNKFRKSEAKRLPPGLFDLLMGAIRERKPLPPVPPAPPIIPLPPPPPQPDPNQMNLF